MGLLSTKRKGSAMKSTSVNVFMIFMFFVVLLNITGIAFSQDKTEIAAYIKHVPDIAPPVIDGVLDDEAWNYATQGRPSQGQGGWRVRIHPDYPIDSPVQPGVIDAGKRPDNDADASFQVYALYDDEYLYIAVATLDDTFVNHLAPGNVNGETWNEDSVEIFIDGNHNRVSGDVNSHPEEYATGGQFVMTSAGAIRHQEAGNPKFGNTATDDWFAAVTDNSTATGSFYEFRFKLSKIGNPKFGSVIGFNVGMNDADDPSSTAADYQIRWTGKAHQEDTYGNLEFGRRAITAPLITTPITIDGKITEPVWSTGGKGKGGVPFGPFEGSTKPKDLADQSFDLYVLHDAEYLYVAVDVHDSEVITDTEPGKTGVEDGYTWYDDSVEIFIDGDHSHTLGNNTGIGLGGQLVITANNSYRDANAATAGEIFYGPDKDWYALTTLTKDGYSAEFKVKKSSVFTPADIKTIGFDIAINEDDSDPPTEKDTGFQIKWNGLPHVESTYGDLILGGAATKVVEWDLF